VIVETFGELTTCKAFSNDFSFYYTKTTTNFGLCFL